MDDSSLEYWAALDPDRLAKRAMDKVRAFRSWFRATGYADKALKGWRYANGWTDAGETSSRLQMGGERQQLVKTVVNGVRPLRQRTVAMVLSGSPEMQPIASNSDAAAREQADLSRGVLEHLHRVHRRKQRDREVLSLAMDMGEGALVVEWDARAGKPVAVDIVKDGDGAPVLDEKGHPVTEPSMWEGALRYWVASAFDIYRDPGLRDWQDAAWVIVRRWVSKYRLAAQYPEKAERIVSISNGRASRDIDDLFDLRMLQDAGSESDMVAEYVLWHLDTPEMEGGREFRFLEDGTWLADGAYPYDGPELPAKRLTPESVGCTSLGYSNIFDALGLSDALNAIASGMVTNVTKGAVPPIIEYEGGNLAKGTPIGTGHVVVKVSRPDLAPHAMEMPQTPPEAYKLAEVLERWRLEGMGLNETSMGRPPYSGMAASAMALLDAKADEYQDGLRSGFLSYLEEAATFELRILKRYAHEERIAQVAGKAKGWMAKSYSAKDLSLVDAIHVEPVGPASRSQAGRLAMLETFRNFEVPLSAEQIVEVSQTGQYEADFEAPLANRYRIREENEGLMQGIPPPVILYRTHWLDIPEHLALLNSPSVTEKPEVVDAVLTTVSLKLQAWRSMPADMLALLGGPPPPPPGPPAGMVPPVPTVPGTEQPPGGEPPPTNAAAGAVNALDPNAEAPELPAPPDKEAA